MKGCACCGYQTIEKKGCFEICPICYWEDDLVQEADPWFLGGANNPSLYQAQINYKLYGAIEERFQKNVRSVNSKDLKCSTWRALTDSDKKFCTTPMEIEKNWGQSNLASYNYWERNK